MNNNEPKKIGLLDLLIAILERKWFFIISMIIFCVVGVIYSLCLTKYYTAKAVIMKPIQKYPTGLSSLLGKDLPISGLLKSLDLSGSDVDNFLSILLSRRLSENVIEHFNLIKYYGFHKKKKFFIEDVIKQFNKTIKVQENKYGNIEIFVTDSNPKIAADIANYMLFQLDSIVYILAKESAKNSRIFFEERLNIIKCNLDSAAKRLVTFQRENNYIELEQQTKSSIEALARVEAEKMAIDIEIAQLQNQFGSNNQRILDLQKQKRVLERKIDNYMTSGGGNLIIALKDAPQKSVEYGFLLRDLKIQEALYEFVLQLHEQAKFSEANNVPSIQVLEYAKIPQKKSKPKRSIICLLFFFSGFSITTIYILSEKWYKIQKNNNTLIYHKIKKVFELIRI